jgi:hypothetical protein
MGFVVQQVLGEQSRQVELNKAFCAREGAVIIKAPEVAIGEKAPAQRAARGNIGAA